VHKNIVNTVRKTDPLGRKVLISGKLQPGLVGRDIVRVTGV